MNRLQIDNRLQLVQMYMSLSLKQKYPDKYVREQKLSKKIIEKQDKKIAEKR